MARDFYLKGFGWTRAGCLCALALIALAGGACAAREMPLGPWGYDFRLGTFSDQRPDDDAKLMAAVPFNIEGFMQGWHRSVQRSVFANEPAKLDVTLRSYEATSSGRSYAITMDVGIRGRGVDGRDLGATNARCDAIVVVNQAAWEDFWQQTREQGNTGPLTPTARNATMWQKVMDSCTKQLATQFGNVLAAGGH